VVVEKTFSEFSPRNPGKNDPTPSKALFLDEAFQLHHEVVISLPRLVGFLKKQPSYIGIISYAIIRMSRNQSGFNGFMSLVCEMITAHFNTFQQKFDPTKLHPIQLR